MENIFELENPNRLMLQNVLYHRSTKNEPEDILDIVYKDLDTNEIKKKSIINPNMAVYITKPEYRDYDYNKSNIKKDMVERVFIPYKNLTTGIAKALGDENLNKFIRNCFDNKDYRSLKKVHLHRNVFASDFDIEDYVYIMWNLHYKNDLNKKPTNVFMDIETDIYHHKGFAKAEFCPIDLITIIDEESMTSHTFFLKTKDNPLIEKFIKDINSFKKECKDEFNELYGDLEYKFYAYDEEIELIRDTFKLLHVLQRTFVFFWNMSFDIPYIIERLEVLGYNPIDIMCDPRFTKKECYYVKDNLHFDRGNKGDYFKLSSYSKFLCQLNDYAAIRKGGHAIGSYRLTDVGEKELRDSKYDFSDNSSDLAKLSRENFKAYVKYNIKDVLLQMGINKKTRDSEYIYFEALSTATRFDKIFRQTVFLRNTAYVEYDKQGLIIGNNHNITNYDLLRKAKESNSNDDEINQLIEKADGALVTDPLLNEHTGVSVLGMRSKFIYDFVIDMDFSSMYPNIIITFNIAACTLIGKLIVGVKAKEYYMKHDIEVDNYDAGKDFMENYLSNNPLMLGKKWFNLPDIDELDDLLMDELNEELKEVA